MLYAHAGEVNHGESIDWRDDFRSTRVSYGFSAKQQYLEATSATFRGNIYLGNIGVETVSFTELAEPPSLLLR